MLSIVAWALAHCNVCIDPQKPKFTENPAILSLFYGNSQKLVGQAIVNFTKTGGAAALPAQ